MRSMVKEKWRNGGVRREELWYVATELKQSTSQLVENEEFSFVFKEDSLLLQWSN